MAGHKNFNVLTGRMSPESQARAAAKTWAAMNEPAHMRKQFTTVEALMDDLNDDHAELDHAAAGAEKRVRDHEAAMAAFKVVNEEDSEILRELARR